ncbi:hypothetical protein RRF57_000314 [Xylaria bambusicola]|uniref:Uncharacterized protein n=1 Tax=Xylaria bambusicola TaxID=326684 RepID=A0AAN7UEC6_9PEZI
MLTGNTKQENNFPKPTESPYHTMPYTRTRGGKALRRQKTPLTSDGLHVASTLPSCHKNRIALASIGIVVFQKKELINAVIVQGRDFDDDANRTGQAALDDKILLAADLYTDPVSIYNV